jgi:hypothetical protein
MTIFRNFLNKEVESKFKKDKIVALLENFSPIFDWAAADAVNCSTANAHYHINNHCSELFDKYANIRGKLRDLREQYLDEHKNDRGGELEKELRKTKKWQLLEKRLNKLRKHLIRLSRYPHGGFRFSCTDLIEPIILDDYDKHYNELYDKYGNARREMRELEEQYLNEHKNDDVNVWDLSKELRNTKEYQSLRKKYDIIVEQIIELFRKYLDKEVKGDRKKDKIVAIKKKFPDASNYRVARAVNCSKNYASQFKIELDGSVYYREGRKTDEKIRKAVLKRDNYSCVACGTKNNLEVHHISTHIDVVDNLVTLCHNCHYYAHDGDYTEQPHGPNKFSEWPEHINKAKMEYILRSIDGVGPVTIERLYENFKTIENLKKASIKDLIKIPPINEAIAKRIKRCL